MKVSLPIRLLKLDDGFHLMVSLRVNGKLARMLIDTGASKTVFDKERIAQFVSKKKIKKHDQLSTGLGTRTMKSSLVNIEKIGFGKLICENYSAVAMNLTHVNFAYEQIGQKPIDGVLGSDLLTKYRAVIDYPKKKLFLSK